uniref:Uncharacterized protein n=1 Tax=Euplotes harpa TaxID=151035 RepID=A0A7S3JIG2_9SPIT|mmetsp:Transcript_42243/g.49124  ORF Transcript_42243/g.49124 Transcript_42243/m.49124 type:complete len:149 (+) Transcript_42243:2030-2476(+)
MESLDLTASSLHSRLISRDKHKILYHVRYEPVKQAEKHVDDNINFKRTSSFELKSEKLEKEDKEHSGHETNDSHDEIRMHLEINYSIGVNAHGNSGESGANTSPTCEVVKLPVPRRPSNGSHRKSQEFDKDALSIPMLLKEGPKVKVD